jgi:predicted RNA-binding Zn ribbon-like protein
MEEANIIEAKIEWDLDAGHPALNFVNTLEWRGSSSPNDLLMEISNFIEWALAAELVDAGGANAIRVHVKKHPRVSQQSFKRIVAARELFYRIFSSIAQDDEPIESDLLGFNKILSDANSQVKLVKQSGSYQWSWEYDALSLDVVLWMLARAAAELLTSSDIQRLGECADDRGCAYIFIDVSRNHSRRWCSMEGCGNRAKAQRHYRRKENPKK